jgi:hypothetical protein
MNEIDIMEPGMRPVSLDELECVEGGFVFQMFMLFLVLPLILSPGSAPFPKKASANVVV